MSAAKRKRSESGVSRREWLVSGGLTLVSVVAATSAARTSSSSRPTTNPRKKRLGMVIDLDRCTGCRACEVACKAENGIRLGCFRSWVSEKEVGRFPRVTRYFLPRLCNHCQESPCRRVCPTGATYRREDGLIAIDKTKCIGCRHCMGACPYQSRYFNALRDEEGESRFPATTHGTVDKCDLCAHRIDKGIAPACVNTCPMSARTFGDLNDPESDVHRLVETQRATRLLPELGTEPSVYYVGGDPDVFSKGA
jgi:tetrathionate reductase subunit B